MLRTITKLTLRGRTMSMTPRFAFSENKDPKKNKPNDPFRNFKGPNIITKLQNKIEEYLLKIKTQEIKQKLQKFSNKTLDSIKHFEYQRYFNRKNYLLFLIFGVMAYYLTRKRYIGSEEYNMLLNNRQIDSVKCINNQTRFGQTKYLEITTKDNKKYYYIVMDFTSITEELTNSPQVKIQFLYKNDFGMTLDNYSIYLLGAGFVLLMFMMNANMASNNISKSNTGGGVDIAKRKYQMVKNVSIRFKDVAGMEQSKLEIQEFVDILKNPKKYKEVGAKIPRGALLTGPPGTGKTLLAKACAGEAGVPFFFTSGSQFVQKYVGVGASRVRDLFKQAKAMSPSIIWIDEIDAIGRKRTNDIGSNDEKDGTLNQLLVEMDGFNTDTGVIVMAATNRKELLDKALTRPGRFDRIIEVDLPDLKERKQIFVVHLTPLKLSPEKSIQEYAKRLATLTPGFSGADISNICNQAAILAARKDKKHVQTIDFQLATQKVLGGVEKTKLLSEQQRKIVAVHESGHAVVSWFLEGASPLLKVTIIPRSKGALGFAQYLPSESKLQTKQQLIDSICFILGGRCAQELFFGKVTTGAYDDLQKAYSLAQQIVTRLGMGQTSVPMGYRSGQFYREYSEQTTQMIDKQIDLIIKNCSKVTRQIIKDKRDYIQKLSNRLMQSETLDAKSIMQVLGKRPFQPHENYKAFLDMYEQDQKQLKQLKQKQNQSQNQNQKQKDNDQGIKLN